VGHERWSGGDAYEAYMGRWSRRLARVFVRWLAAPPGGRWLDVGCGTGALTAAVLDTAAPAEVTGLDGSAAFVEAARAREPRARFEVGDAAALPWPDARFDAVVSGLVLNFVPDPARVVAELARVAAPGGLVAVYVWDYAGGMEMLRHFWAAAVAVDPSGGARDEARRFAVCAPEPLRALVVGAGLRDVAVEAIGTPTPFADFDDYWTPFLGGQGPAPGFVATLDDDRRAALRERLRARLPTRPDGSIPLTARAWAVRGVRAGDGA